MSTEPTTTEERIVVLPEVTIPASTRAATETVNHLLDKLMPELRRLHEAAMELRDAKDQTLVALYPYVGGGYDEVDELANRATGYNEVAERLVAIGDMFEADSLYSGGMSLAEIARGGQPNFEPGTFARVDDPEGNPVRVMIERVPWNDHDTYTIVNAADLQTRYGCSHEELRAGIEAEAQAGALVDAAGVER